MNGTGAYAFKYTLHREYLYAKSHTLSTKTWKLSLEAKQSELQVANWWVQLWLVITRIWKSGDNARAVNKFKKTGTDMPTARAFGTTI